MKHIADAAGEHGVPFTVFVVKWPAIHCHDVSDWYWMSWLSMSPSQVPLVKKIIRSVNTRGLKGLRRALQYSAASQIRHLFQRYSRANSWSRFGHGYVMAVVSMKAAALELNMFDN